MQPSREMSSGPYTPPAWPEPYPPAQAQPAYPPPPEVYQQGGWSPPTPSASPWPQEGQPVPPGAYRPPPWWYKPSPMAPPAQPSPWETPLAPWPGQPAPLPASKRKSSGSAIANWIVNIIMAAKLALPFGSMLISFAAYAVFFGWQFGLGITILLFVHEMGHFVVIKAKGLPVSLPIFIPLLGAFVAMRKMPLNVRDEAEIGIAGPIAGTVAGVICLLIYAQFGMAIMLPLAYFSFFLNLLNLIPVSPLDGARVTSAISKWIWPLGLIGMAVGIWYTWSLLLIVLFVIGLFQLVERFRVKENTAYYTISIGARIYVTTIYFGLVAVLVYACFTLEPLVRGAGGLF